MDCFFNNTPTPSTTTGLSIGSGINLIPTPLGLNPKIVVTGKRKVREAVASKVAKATEETIGSGIALVPMMTNLTVPKIDIERERCVQVANGVVPRATPLSENNLVLGTKQEKIVDLEKSIEGLTYLLGAMDTREHGKLMNPRKIGRDHPHYNNSVRFIARPDASLDDLEALERLNNDLWTNRTLRHQAYMRLYRDIRFRLDTRFYDAFRDGYVEKRRGYPQKKGPLRRLEFCCAFECFERPLTYVDGKACETCGAMGYCRCFCLTYMRKLNLCNATKRKRLVAKQMYDLYDEDRRRYGPGENNAIGQAWCCDSRCCRLNDDCGGCMDCGSSDVCMCYCHTWLAPVRKSFRAQCKCEDSDPKEWGIDLAPWTDDGLPWNELPVDDSEFVEQVALATINPVRVAWEEIPKFTPRWIRNSEVEYLPYTHGEAWYQMGENHFVVESYLSTVFQSWYDGPVTYKEMVQEYAQENLHLMKRRIQQHREMEERRQYVKQWLQTNSVRRVGGRRLRLQKRLATRRSVIVSTGKLMEPVAEPVFKAQCADEDLRAVLHRLERANKRLAKDKAGAEKKAEAKYLRQKEKNKDKVKQSRREGRDRKFAAQMLSELFGLPRRVQDTLGDVSSAATGVADFTGSLNSLIDLVKTYFESARNQLDLQDLDITLLCRDLCVFLRGAHYGDLMLMACGFTGLCKLFKVGMKLVTSVISKLKNMFVAEQGEMRPQSGPIGDEKWLFAAIVGVVSVFLRGDKVNYSSMMRNLSDFGRAAIGWTKLGDMITYIFEFVRNQYNEYTTGKTSAQLDLEARWPGLKPLYERTELLREAPMSYFDKSAELAGIMIRTFKEWDTLRVAAVRAFDSTNRDIFGAICRSLTGRYDRALSSPARLVSARKLPACVFFFGDSGCGKTTLTGLLEAHIYKKYLTNSGFAFSHCSFGRKAENEYWDGYLNQPIVRFDDMLQSSDTKSVPNPEYLDLIRLVNEDQYQLHMADIADKKDTYFDSQFILCSSNVKLPKPVSISEPKAFLRRLQLAVEVKIDPAFMTGKKLDMDKVRKAAQANGSTDTLQTFFYRMDYYDPANGNVLQADRTYEQFLEDFDSLVDENKKNGDGIRAELLKLAGCEVGNVPGEISEFVEKVKAQTGEEEKVEEVVIDVEDVEAPMEAEDLTLTTMEILSNLFDADQPPPTEVKIEGKTGNSLMDVVLGVPVAAVSVGQALWKQELEKVKAASQTFYDYVLSKGATCVAGVKTAGSKIFQFLISAWEALRKSGATGLVVSILAPMLVKYVGSSLWERWCGSCVLSTTTSFATFCMTKPCMKCTFCKTNWREERKTHAYGSEHGIGFLKYLMARETDEKSDEVMRLHALVLQYLRLHKEELANGTLFAESRAAEPLRNRKSVVAESRSAEAVRARKTVVAETEQLAAATPLSAQCYASPVDCFCDEKQIAQAGDAVQVDQWSRVTYNNLVRLSCRDANERTFSQNAVYVCGRIVLTTNHFFAVNPKVLTLTNPGQEIGTEVPMEKIRKFQLRDISGKSVDLCFLELPRNVPSRPNILKYFAKPLSSEVISEGGIIFSGLRKVANVTAVHSFITDKFTVGKAYSYADDFGNTHWISSNLMYDMTTTNGDCGGLIYLRNNLVSAKIAGMHVAGSTDTGMAMQLSLPFLERNLYEAQFDSISLVDGRAPFQPEMLAVKLTSELPSDSLLQHGDCLSLGTLPSPSSTGKSQINPSAIHGVVTESTMKPAYLHPFKKDGELVDPLVNGMVKVLGVQADIPTDVLEIAANDVTQTLDSDDLREVLTFEEAIAGRSGTYEPINRSTSPGYPYNLLQRGNGKRSWLGTDDEYIFDESVRSDVDDLLQRCKNNQRGDVVFMATLKDERRPIAKVNAGKTRVFEAAPMHFVIAVRMYFLAFMQSVSRNRIANEIAVGTNVYNLDWHKIGCRMAVNPTRVIAGDFSNFDGSLNQTILWKICDIINEWYNDSEENQQIRRVLWEEMCNTNVLVKGELIRQTHSQPSGNPLTVVINSVFNQIVMRMAYVICKSEAGLGKMCDFRQQVEFVTYGDDNILSVSQDVVEWYNQLTITKALATFGLTYTDEAKTGDLVPVRTLDEVSFLKRSFKRDANGFYRAPLDRNTVHEMSNWVKGKAIKSATAENIAASLPELALHGQNVYDEYRCLLQAACKECGVPMTFPTFSEVDSELTLRLFGA